MERLDINQKKQIMLSVTMNDMLDYLDRQSLYAIGTKVISQGNISQYFDGNCHTRVLTTFKKKDFSHVKFWNDEVVELYAPFIEEVQHKRGHCLPLNRPLYRCCSKKQIVRTLAESYLGIIHFQKGDNDFVNFSLKK